MHERKKAKRKEGRKAGRREGGRRGGREEGRNEGEWEGKEERRKQGRQGGREFQGRIKQCSGVIAAVHRGQPGPGPSQGKSHGPRRLEHNHGERFSAPAKENGPVRLNKMDFESFWPQPGKLPRGGSKTDILSHVEAQPGK